MSFLYFNAASGRRPLPGPSRAPLAFHARLPGYEATPLLSLTALARDSDLSAILVKAEAQRFGLPAFKVLGASWAVYRALAEKFGRAAEQWTSVEEWRSILDRWPPICLSSATDGNHGRAVARIARWLGMRARIYMPLGTVDARIDAIRSEGADVIIVDGTYDDAVARAARELEANGMLLQDTAWEGYETIPGWIVEGYSTLLWEIDDALRTLGEPGPTHVLVQIGVGSLADAVVRHFRRADVTPAPVIIGVEPTRAACALRAVEAGHSVEIPGPHDSIMAGLNCGVVSSLSLPVLSSGVDCFVAIDDERAREGMRLLAKAGLVAGETGAAGLGGLIELLARVETRARLGLTSASRVLLICTEGATDPASYRTIVGTPPAASAQSRPA